MKHLSRYIAALSMILLAAVIFAHSTAGGDGAPHTTVTLLMHYGQDPAMMDHITEQANIQLEAHGYPYRLEIIAGNYQDYVDTSSSSYGYPFRESVMEYDIFFEATLGNQMGLLVASGMIHDLTDLLPEYPDLAEAIGEDCLIEGRLGGRTYALPVGGVLGSEGVYESGIMIRRDIVDDLGADMPTTFSELVELALLAKENGQPYRLVYSWTEPPYAFHRTYDEWPFFVDARSLFVITAEGELTSYPHSDIFVKDIEALNELRSKGVLRDVHPGEVYGESQKWNFLAALQPMLFTQAYNVEIIQLSPDAPSFRMRAFSDYMIYISAAADARAALGALEAIYTQQDIYDAFMYGQADVDWVINDAGELQYVQTYVGNPLICARINRPFAFDTTLLYYTLPAGGEVIDFPAASFQYAQRDQDVWKDVQTVYFGGRSLSL